MSAQREPHMSYRVKPIPRSINAIGDALGGADRARFYKEVLAAEDSAVADVMRRWWKKATLNTAPGAELSRENARSGRSLVSVDDLLPHADPAP
ncbi:hypothetical protein ACFVV7_26820 [Streptomyces globisporus]|uniref:hypothetical protein n=1 Tax=Streptomyces globisporus TaxID=1908 RepID=UPI0036DA81A3